VIAVKEATHPANAKNVVDPKTGVIFKYLEISANISANDIANVTINFQVEKSWINLTSVDKKTIALYRYFNNSWSKLPTKIMKETSDIVSFQAISPGLSIFAIAGEKIKRFEIPLWIIFVVVGIAVAIILVYLFWPVKTENEKEELLKLHAPKEEKEDVFARLKEKWEKLSRKKK
jgi:uncharacterized protein YacL